MENVPNRGGKNAKKKKRRRISFEQVPGQETYNFF